MPRIPVRAQEASFVAYLHYLEDLVGVIGGHYGLAGSLVLGLYQAAGGRPQDQSWAGGELAGVQAELAGAWRNVVRLEQLTARGMYDRQVNGVAPRLAFSAVTNAVRALAAAEGERLSDDPGDALDYAGGRISEGLLPHPWSAHCTGCPQLGTGAFDGVAAAPEGLNLFAGPDPSTSGGRLAMLLRTTRERALEVEFAAARLRDVRPGRTRRNLRMEEKLRLAASTAPTTLLDVFWRVHERTLRDDGECFVEAPPDETEAFRFAEAVRLLAARPVR
jgi:hypothetical protein